MQQTNTPSPWLAPRDHAILGRSVSDLVRRMSTGELTALEVTEAHIARAQEVQSPLNALALPLFDQARRAAQQADQNRATGKPLGPLHGLPITIKECYHLAGTASSLGLARFANEIIPADGPLVRRLKAAGAIILGKSNVPQAMLLHETDNPLFGRTNNPWNVNRSPGGSSGGEAALIAAGASTAGLANDLGGSIRVPAHFCGICGIKPTAKRLTNTGCRNNLSGLKVIATQSGLLARSVEDVWLMLQTLCQRMPGEPNHADEIHSELRDPRGVHLEKLRVGVVETDNFSEPAPAVRRAVREAAQALQSLGVKTIDLPIEDTDSLVSLYLGLLSADGATALNELLQDGPVDRRIARLARIGRLTGAKRSALTALAGMLGQSSAKFMLGNTGRLSPEELEILTVLVGQARDLVALQFESDSLDAIIFPPHALPALTHGASLHVPLMASYAFVANLVGYPAGVVPWTQVHPGEESDRRRSLDAALRTARHVEHGSAGLPVGVQVMARPWREDIVLAVMRALEASAPLCVAAKPALV